jgi:hypothetical protein
MFGLGPTEALAIGALAAYLHLDLWERPTRIDGGPPWEFALAPAEPILPGKPPKDEPPEWFIQDQPIGRVRPGR